MPWILAFQYNVTQGWVTNSRIKFNLNGFEYNNQQYSRENINERSVYRVCSYRDLPTDFKIKVKFFLNNSIQKV